MRVRKATHLALTLLVAAGGGVFAGSTQAQTATLKKAAAKTGGAAHGKRTSRRSGRRGRGQKGPPPDRTSEIQPALAKDRSFTRKPKGEWDASALEAASKIQARHWLNAAGNGHA